jgi:hypothetical protein
VAIVVVGCRLSKKSVLKKRNGDTIYIEQPEGNQVTKTHRNVSLSFFMCITSRHYQKNIE